MEASFDPFSVPVRDAATVMLLRDGDAGLEVFMLRRTMAAVFGPGFYVFPGGRVDLGDGSSAAEAACSGLDDTRASTMLGLDRGGLAFWVAAIRECFEEAGVLLAHDAAGEVVRFDDPVVGARFAAHRDALNAGATDLLSVCAAEGLTLDAGTMPYVAHWITPIGERRRFDTRFLVARAPEAQDPLHDDAETIESQWVQPRHALDAEAAGTMVLMPPTIACLQMLTDFSAAGDALVEFAGRPAPAAVLPKIIGRGPKLVRLVLPGEPGYDELELYTDLEAGDER